MNRDTIISLITQEVKGLSAYLTSNDYQNALNDALSDTGWPLPASNNFRKYWLKQRAKRHLLSYLQTEQAYKFKFEQINLQHRFAHLDTLVKRMDREYEKAILENIEEFAGVDKSRIFGTYVRPGFSYDSLGRDTTYTRDNKVLDHPNETD